MDVEGAGGDSNDTRGKGNGGGWHQARPETQPLMMRSRCRNGC